MPDITYVLNDPTTPALVEGVDLPVKPAGMNFKIDGFTGPTTTMYTPEHQAAMCHYSITQAINIMRRVLKQPILNNWSSVQTLYVQPRAGKQLNAFYDRVGLKFFYAMDPVAKQMVYASSSSDVVLHETGHALLDALRPDLFNVQAYEVWALHEAFGDIHSIINALHHDKFIDAVISETQGNLAQSNVLTRLAEEMGRAIYNLTGGRGGHMAGALRNAWNSFTYVAPEKLPRNSSDNQLSNEPHSFSRVFLGAWYDIFCAIYDVQRQSGLDIKTSIINARDVLTSYTYNAIPNAPASIRFFNSFAKAMLVQDKMNGYKYNQIMNAAFMRRNILQQAIRPMAGINWEDFKLMLEPTDEVIEHPEVAVVRSKNITQLTLPDFMVNVEAPNDTYYEFNQQGECVDATVTSPTELVDHARDCVDFLKEKGFIRSDKMTPFEINQEGNLVRSHFAGCYTNNCTNPNQIEYLKCWKPENNSGCGCGGKKKPPCNGLQKGPMVIVQSNTRPQINGFSKLQG